MYSNPYHQVCKLEHVVIDKVNGVKMYLWLAVSRYYHFHIRGVSDSRTYYILVFHCGAQSPRSEALSAVPPAPEYSPPELTWTLAVPVAHAATPMLAGAFTLLNTIWPAPGPGKERAALLVTDSTLCDP